MDEKQLNLIIEILKASVPIFSIIAVIVAAYLNAKFSRKQKMREELFSYKIKSYMKIAEKTHSIKSDYIEKLKNLKNKKQPLIDLTLQHDSERFFGEEYNANILFIEPKMDAEVRVISQKLLELLQPTFFSDTEQYKKESEIKFCKVIELCDDLIFLLQNEVGLYKISTK